MSWFNVVGNVLRGGKEAAEVFVENKENRGERQHQEFLADVDRDLASLQQFAQEFYERKQRSRWDSFVDGLNRLPRPVLTAGILSFFVLAPLDPERFLTIAKAYELMPPGYWALLSVIVGFYFGGRMQIKAQDMELKKNAVKAAKDLVAMKKEFRQLDDDLASPEAKLFDSLESQGLNAAKPNKVVMEWLNKQKASKPN